MQIQDKINHFKSLVQEALQEALKYGATSAEAGLSSGNGLSVSARLGDVENIEYDCDQGLGITVYIDKQKGSASTTDLSPASIKETARAACSIAKFSNADEFAGLPAPDTLACVFPDLELYHPWDIDAERAIKLAIECEQAARSYHPEIVNSEGASVNSHQGIRVLGNTLGFLQGYQSSRHSISCSVIGQRGTEMQRNYWYSVARNAENLETPLAIGTKAATRTLQRLGAQTLSTRSAPVLFAAEIADSLLSSLMGALSGSSLYRKSSFLLNSLNSKIFPDFIHIYEQPLLPGALGSAAFDSEGVATKTKDFISNGIVTSYLLSSYSARKLGMQTTGNAGGVHNLSIDNSGEYNFENLLNQLHTGLVVTELMGQGVNRVTGDYSRGAAGFWVENGHIQYPVEEITIAGNLKDMFNNIVAVGNDVDLRGNIRTGSILIEKMSIAGGK